MPYLRPETVLGRFSGFTLSTIRPAIPDDEEFVRGQTGSMASTLRFLANELEAREQAVARQEKRLRAAFEEVAGTVEDDAVLAAIEEATAALDGRAETVRDREETLLQAADDVLAAVDEALDGQAARAARRPVYDFLDDRVDAQLRMLGREQDDGEGGQ